MFIPDPGSWFITHPGSRIQKPQEKRGVKIIFCHTFFSSHKFHKIENYYIFEMAKKNIWPSFQKIIELLPKTLSLSSKKYGFGIQDPGSEIRDPE